MREMGGLPRIPAYGFYLPLPRVIRLAAACIAFGIFVGDLAIGNW